MSREAVLHGTAYTFDQIRTQREVSDSDAIVARTVPGSEEQRAEE
jgi:hypothetical protein